MSFDDHQPHVAPRPDLAPTQELPAVRVPPAPSGRPGRGGTGVPGWLVVLLVLVLLGGATILAAPSVANYVAGTDSEPDDQTEPTAAPAEPTVDAPPIPTAVVSTDEPGFSQVVNVADRLNVRTGPGTQHDVITSLSDGARHIETTGSQSSGWTEIVVDGQRGWVAGRYLAPDVAPDEAATPAAVSEAARVVCFATPGEPNRVVRLEFRSNDRIQGVFVTIPAIERLTGVLRDGEALMTLTNISTNETRTQTWSFGQSSVQPGSEATLFAVACDTIADQVS